MSDPCRNIEVRHAGLGVTARWDGGVTVVLLDDSSRVLGRIPLGEGATTAEVEAALRAIVDYERERRRAANLMERARRAIQRGWALNGAARALAERSRSLSEWRPQRQWTELEPEDSDRESA